MNDSQPPPKRAAKLFHKKSRTGCQQCRSRRVKCDESKPICSNCSRLSLPCVYDRTSSSPRSTKPSASSPANTVVEIPESESRRRRELRLFYQYITDTGPSLALDDVSNHFWVTALCRLALESDSLLYCMYMITALHTEKRSNFTDLEANETCRTYLNMAIHEHHKDLTAMNAKKIEYVCLTSSMLRIHGFARLQCRPLKPYTPPIDWLRITGSSKVLFRQAWGLVRDTPESLAHFMIESVSDFLDDNRNEELRQDWNHLLSRGKPHELDEPWDSEIEEVYASALSLIGGTWNGMKNQKHTTTSVGRRIVVFPMLLPKRFADFVQELRPRALVILAHYFALLSMLHKIWWIGDSGFRELQALCQFLPAEWQSSLEWPKKILRQQDVTIE
ncbi:C6 finger domain protein [Fusarium beomiforme]|uniref:C6 finger domain protein n=1 Tax=Fusarium beomiforme TaxID=44412 RepID=A0A9P5A9J1_9HYPO|nr:C6 finger domain protein [Fusarium beomiforme]